MNKLKASELVALLQKKIKDHGDLIVTVNTQEGSSYTLYQSDDVVNVITWHAKDGSINKTLEIG